MDEKLVRAFIESFEEVFDKDWQHTKGMLGIQEETEEQKEECRAIGIESIPIIAEDGTFLQPKVEDETEDWGHRGRLLELYRKLKSSL